MNPIFNPLIPVIDLNDFDHADRRDKFISDLGEAFQSHGFVAVKNVGIDQSILEKANRAVKQFFLQELEAKESIRSIKNSGERGYVVGETPKTQPRHVVDLKEILHIGRELSLEQQKALGYPENLWPENSRLKESVMPLFEKLEKIMQPISIAASEYLGESPALFQEMMHEGDHLLRFLHYLRNPGEKKNWAATHTDMNFLTLIPGGASEGLQVQLKDKKWVDILVPKDSVVINVGDSLENLTNGFFRSGVHRVVSKPNADPERWSVVFHGHTRHDLEMGPLPSTIELTGGEQLFPNAKGSELLYAQIAAVGRASDEMLKDLAQSGVMDKKIKYGKASEKVMRILAEKGLASESVSAELSRIDHEGVN